MSAFKGTPGPWHVEDERTHTTDAGYQLYCATVEVGGDEYRGGIASLQSCEHIAGIGRKEATANARLIAAAPDMLNALTVLADAAEARGIPCDAARAAIARATGEQP